MLAQILIIVIVAIAIAAIAERRNVQPALLVAIVGLAASFIPGLTRLELEPDVILSLVLPPLLFSAARDFSFASFTKRLGPIINLGVLQVFGLAALVSIVAVITVPGIDPAMAIILGAVVAPPDAVTAIAIGSKAGLPSGLMTVLKGESLINDAAALTLFAGAVAAVAGTQAFIDGTALYFLYAAVVGFVLGVLIGNLAQLARRRLTNPSLATAISVVVPFATYLLAEELHASGVLAVVAAGFTLGHHGIASGYRERMQEQQFWRTVDTLLETFIFAYIGLQLRFVIADAQEAGYNLWQLTGAGVAIFLTTIVVRFVWVFGTAFIVQRKRARRRKRRRPPAEHSRRRTPPTPEPPLTWQENLVLSWTGMRGVVTLAAAAGVPLVTVTGAALPGREAIVALAFFVTIATLLVQGLTLPILLSWLKLEDPNARKFEAAQRKLAERLVEEASKEAMTAYQTTHDSPLTRQIAERMAQRTKPRSESKEMGQFDWSEALAFRNMLLDTRRKRLIAARDASELDDTVVRDMLERLDLEQALTDSMEQPRRD